LMTLWSSYRQKTDPNICPLGPGTATAAEHPPWAGRSPWPASQQRSWWGRRTPREGAGDQLAEGIAGDRLPVHSHPHPRFACTHLGLPTASRSFFNRHDGSRIGSVVPSSTARAEFTTPMQNASYERRLELLGRRASALPKCSLRQSVVVTPISSVPEMGQLAHPS
jgi:hypothetical protein